MPRGNIRVHGQGVAAGVSQLSGHAFRAWQVPITHYDGGACFSQPAR